MLIRPAEPANAAVATELVRRSIAILCADDYRHDPAVLERWLANKTVANFERWIRAPDRAVFVCERDHALAGVGMVAGSGEVQLNYVAPEARFGGVSKALVQTMEAWLGAREVAEATLFSTRMARRFYDALGYEAQGEVASLFGTLPPMRMRKRLDRRSATDGKIAASPDSAPLLSGAMMHDDSHRPKHK